MPKFEKGKSGNPAGRPKGTQNALTVLRKRLDAELRHGAVDVLKKVLAQARQGCRVSQKMILDRVLPVVLYEGGTRGGKTLVHVDLRTVTGQQPIISLAQVNGTSFEDRTPSLPDGGTSEPETVQDSSGGPAVGKEHTGGVEHDPGGAPDAQ